LEWSSDSSGQVLGGRWKTVHHWLQQYLYTDVHVACGQSVDDSHATPLSSLSPSDVLCYVKLDSSRGAGAHRVTATVFPLSDARLNTTVITDVVLPPGPGSVVWFTLSAALFNASTVTLLSVLDDSERLVAHNFFISAPPSALQLPTLTADCLELTIGQPTADGHVPIHLVKTTPAVLMWLTLTTLHAGRFSSNAFVLTDSSTSVQFLPWDTLNRTLLVNSLRVEFANMHARHPTSEPDTSPRHHPHLYTARSE
jgi:hypothetical protein